MKNSNWKKCIICSDSREVIRSIPDNSIDLILTDPPYNLGKHSTGNIPLPGRSAMNNDVAEWDKIDFNPEEWSEEFIRILKPTGNLFIFTSYNQLGRWYNCLDHRFDTSNFMIWHKTNPAPKIYKAGFLNSCEMIFTCWNKKHTWNFISQKEMHNFLESPICMRPERLSDPKHPTQKPISILKKMIEIASNTEDIVFDPFMGVGSTGVAALELGRRFIGIEIDAKYFMAAKKRIDNTLQKLYLKEKMKTNNHYTTKTDEEQSIVSENFFPYQKSLFELDDFFNFEEMDSFKSGTSTGLQPIIKWPGGKEKELKYILPNLPAFNRYYEPFVGGGSVYTAIQAKEYHINDLSAELISLYKNIANIDSNFFKYSELIDQAWRKAAVFFQSNLCLIDTYVQFKNEILTEKQLKDKIHYFCVTNNDKILNIIGPDFNELPCILPQEMEINLYRKMTRMRKLEKERHELPLKDLHTNIETAIKSAVYMNFRYLYNKKEKAGLTPAMSNSLFLFIRNYAYSGMFRYSSKGEFNVPYGGIAYNSKLMEKKLAYYRSGELQKHFINTHIYNMDFEDFLKSCNPKSDDFIFLDPPYDSEFSTYAQNAFTRKDQERLANYLLCECHAKWMMIIKNTDFIYNLYNKASIKISTFDKEYVVSFMNRNDKKATHLLITNY